MDPNRKRTMKKKKKKNPFGINKFALDKEWERQPELYIKYAEELAEAKTTLDKCKTRHDSTCAMVSMEIRKSPEDFNVQKVTDASVNAAILLDKRVKLKKKRVIEARYRVSLLDAAVGACEHRKKTLENLVNLWSQSYFAEPRVDGKTMNRMEDKRKRKTRKKINDGIGGR